VNAADQVRIRLWTSQACIVTLICISVTAPAIFISRALPYFKIEELLLPFVLGIYFWLLMIGVARPIRFNWMFVIGFLFFLCNAISIWYGSRILGHSVILRDFYELPKVWFPVAFFTLAYEAELSELSLRRLITCFSFCILLVCLYAWSQFFGLAIAYKLNPYYSMGGHIDSALEYARRVYATMGNANVLGMLMTWCVVLFVLAALFHVGNLICNIMVAVACLVTLVMTGSRYGVFTVSFAFLLIFALVAATARRRYARVVALILLLPAFVLIFEGVAASNRRTFERYQTLKEPLQVDSFRERVEGGWPVAWADFKSSPVFGHGPGKAFLFPRGGVIDSEYLSVLREKGSVGFLVFLGYYLYPLYLIRRWQRAARSAGLPAEAEWAPANMVCIYASFTMGILALISNIGMSTFYSPFVQGFLWLWLGIGAGAAKKLCVVIPMRRAAYANATHLQPQQVSV